MSLDPRLAAHAVMDAGDAIVTLDQNAKVTSWNRAAEQLWGPAAEALGLAPGQQIERESYELLFVQRKAPDGTPLGRPPGRNTKAAEIYARLPAAEAPATLERKRELRAHASRETRQSPLFFDLTLSLSKSISLFHASLGDNARLAREAGDADGERYWSGLVAEMDEMIMQAVHAGFCYFQREAAYTRTGSHHARAGGRETASGGRRTWRWRTGCSTPRGTATCSCTSARRRHPDRR